MQKYNCEIEVLVNGRPVREYDHEYKTYIEGRKGKNFSLKLKNNSSSRKLFVPSIDGLSVIDGKEASYESRGYIVPAYSSITVDGWRKSNKDVAQFYFSDSKKSYGKRIGKGDNLGIIGCAVFDEKYEYFPGMTLTTTASDKTFYYKQPKFMCGGTNPLSMPVTENNLRAFSGSVVNCSSSLGTGWGETKHSSVTESSFERFGSPTVFEILYNTRENLEKIGIKFHKEMQINAFPANYCKPPRD